MKLLLLLLWFECDQVERDDKLVIIISLLSSACRKIWNWVNSCTGRANNEQLWYRLQTACADHVSNLISLPPFWPHLLFNILLGLVIYISIDYSPPSFLLLLFIWKNSFLNWSVSRLWIGFSLFKREKELIMTSFYVSVCYFFLSYAQTRRRRLVVPIVLLSWKTSILFLLVVEIQCQSNSFSQTKCRSIINRRRQYLQQLLLCHNNPSQ